MGRSAAKRAARNAEQQLRLQEQQMKAQQDALLAKNMLESSNMTDAVVKTEVGGDAMGTEDVGAIGTVRKRKTGTNLAQSLGIR
jgi:hypothetical protein